MRAQAYSILGYSEYMLYDYPGSETAFVKCLKIYGSMDEKSQYAEPSACVSLQLGKMYLDSGQYEKAAAILSDTAARMKKLAWKNPAAYELKYADSCAALGTVYKNMHDSKAVELLATAQEIYDRNTC